MQMHMPSCAWRALVAGLVVACLAQACSLPSDLDGGGRDWIQSASTEQLVAALDSPGAIESGEFGSIVAELGTRTESADLAAPALARALALPTRDSYSAGQALLAMGAVAKPAISELEINLSHDRAEVRMFSALVLGVIGPGAGCAVPLLGQLLWDDDQYVRSAAAAALESIAEEDLVEPQDELNLSSPDSVTADLPQGHMTGKARRWWLDTGQRGPWPPCATP
jgi:hypothetical protein